MQIMITHGSLARTRVLQFARWQIVAAGMVLCLMLMSVSGGVYHYIFLKAAREGWPVVGQVVSMIFRDEMAQRERVMRENLDAMAQKVGEMQAKLVRLEAMGDRVSTLVGVKSDGLKPAPGKGGQGGLYVPLDRPSLTELNEVLTQLDERTDTGADIFTLIESRLLESQLQALMVPSVAPVDGPVGSGFGVRPDPFTGRAALHTGLDFPADVGTAIHAAAGGVVALIEQHPQYGRVLEISHGSGLSTRYAHVSRTWVKTGDLVKRGQLVAEVGNSGRSTGPHLHFEVLVGGVPQNPARFLAGNSAPADRLHAAAR
jgi:murein DD-endopeptidase MepM/ murein hydrolase activator NlpD